MMTFLFSITFTAHTCVRDLYEMEKMYSTTSTQEKIIQIHYSISTSNVTFTNMCVYFKRITAKTITVLVL